ncbi:hypothetical protein [Williamsia sp.]|uniref:hypothetical protein n=1 Tax=Williamsia sp. TaxID=1872085 RepID=UPI002F928B90
MSKHRARRVSTPRWSVYVAAIALIIGGSTLFLTNTSASAHCPSWSTHCSPHSSTTPVTTSSGTDLPEPEDSESSTTSSMTTSPPRVPIPTYRPPTGGTGSTSSGQDSQQPATRPPGDLPKTQPSTSPETPDAAGIAPVVPPSDSGSGGGPTGGGAAIESVPTVEPATPDPAPAAEPRPIPTAVSAAPVVTAIDPVTTSSQCLLGSGDSGGCYGADTARDLAPAGLFVLGALALLGSGSFLESLRGSLRS